MGKVIGIIVGVVIGIIVGVVVGGMVVGQHHHGHTEGEVPLGEGIKRGVLWIKRTLWWGVGCVVVGWVLQEWLVGRRTALRQLVAGTCVSLLVQVMVSACWLGLGITTDHSLVKAVVKLSFGGGRC